MFIAKNENRLVEAVDAVRNKEYFCPACNRKVVLKRGQIVISHFAHLNNQECFTFSENESLDHLEQKLKIVEILKKDFDVKPEAVIKNISQRADILVDNKIAIEFQLSPISNQKLLQRNQGYKKVSVKVIWILGRTYFSKLNKTTINRFINDLNEVYLWGYAKDSVFILSNFLDNKFKKTPAKLKDILFKTEAIKSPPKEKEISVKEIFFLQNAILKGQFDKKIVQEIYQNFGKSIVLAPIFVHLGNEFELSTSNLIFRLKLLIELKRNPTIKLNVLLAKMNPYFAIKSTSTLEFKREIILRTISQMNTSIIEDKVVVNKQLRWFNNLQEKISAIEDIYEYKRTN